MQLHSFLKSLAPVTTSEAEPSEVLKANSYQMKCWMGGYLPLKETERRALGAQRLKEAFSSMPWHVRNAEDDPDYWNTLYASQVNW